MKSKIFKEAQSELISTILLTGIVLAIGSVLFYTALTWSGDYTYRARILNIAEGTRYDFDVGIEDAYSDSNNLYLLIHIIRIGSVELTGVSPLISVETTNDLLSVPDKIWFVNLTIISATGVYYSQPAEPANIQSGLITYTQCSSSSTGLIQLSAKKAYVKSMNEWVVFGDYTKNIYRVEMCKLPLPPAPLGQLFVKISIPLNSVGRYVVISIWIMVGDTAYNIKNVLYPNIY